MAEPLHPAATEHLPSFITAPGQTDVLMVVTAIILAVSVLLFGILFFRLHSLPERMAHRSHKLQFEIVAVLGLLALLTHIHAFWVAGLLLALIDLPDFGGWLGRIAGAVERIAGLRAGDDTTQPKPHDAPVHAGEADNNAAGTSQAASDETFANAKEADTGAAAGETKTRSRRQKETMHA